MKLSERIDVLVQLGDYLAQGSPALETAIKETYRYNRWFIEENSRKSIEAIRSTFLRRDALEKWVAHYPISDTSTGKRVGLILAGNIPLVGFHDVLSVFIAGHIARIKLSEKDKYLLPHLIDVLQGMDARIADQFEFISRLTDIDAVIATGSNNSARYFDAYFSKYPHIIRKNRNGVAVLTGAETKDELVALGIDVFQYFGLGCRNVSKLYLPANYNFEPLLEALHEHREIVLNDKYKNNFDYNFTMLILNGVAYQSNGCILMTEDTALQSRIAQLHYEYYVDEADLNAKLAQQMESIQCVVGRPIAEVATIPFGKAQAPDLMDYADGVDTLTFLTSLGAAQQ